MPSQLSAHPTQQFFLQASSQAHFCTPAQPADQQPNFSSLSSSQWNRTHTMPDNFGAPKSTIGPQFCSPLPVAFYIKDQLGSWSGEDATVLDPNGKLAFTVDARVLSLRRCRVLKDAAGLSVCAMQEKVNLLLTSDNHEAHAPDRLCRGAASEPQCIALQLTVVPCCLERKNYSVCFTCCRAGPSGVDCVSQAFALPHTHVFCADGKPQQEVGHLQRRHSQQKFCCGHCDQRVWRGSSEFVWEQWSTVYIAQMRRRRQAGV